KHAHADQTDKAGVPYWQHPVAVMQRLGDHASESERLAALLHDVIEDTGHTAADLRAMGYSNEVVEAVLLLSRPNGPDRPTYLDWIRSLAASGNRTAIKVKIPDLEHKSPPARVARLPAEQPHLP